MTPSDRPAGRLRARNQCAVRTFRCLTQRSQSTQAAEPQPKKGNSEFENSESRRSTFKPQVAEASRLWSEVGAIAPQCPSARGARGKQRSRSRERRGKGVERSPTGACGATCPTSEDPRDARRSFGIAVQRKAKDLPISDPSRPWREALKFGSSFRYPQQSRRSSELPQCLSSVSGDFADSFLPPP